MIRACTDACQTRRWGFQNSDGACVRLQQHIDARPQLAIADARAVEAALPLSYLWRLGNETSVRVLARERAVSWFGRLGVWDTQDNNGVLIYLLLAERSIELVADRGLSARVDQARWQAMVDRLAGRLHQGAFEDGLTQALEEVSALLVEFFPAQAGGPNPNELPDLVVRA